MLSSLGARRDRSPTRHQPPRKVFVQEQEVSKPESQPQPQPMIVVQEYQEEESPIQAATKPQLGKDLVEDLPHHSKPEAHAEPLILPDVKSHGDLLGVVALGEPKRQKIGDDNETMEFKQQQPDFKPTPEKNQQAHSVLQAFTVQQEPKQPRIQLDTQHQTQDCQQQVQIQEQSTSQEKTLLQQSVKVRKSQKCAENRPWLQQKAKAEVSVSDQLHKLSSEVLPQTKAIGAALPQPPVSTSEQVKEQAKVTWIQQQQTITVSTSVASQTQVPTADADQAKTNRVSQTHANMTQAQQQQSMRQTTMIQAEQQHSMAVIATVASQPVVTAMDPIQSGPKSVTQTQFHLTEVQPQQSVMQAKMGETQQVTQNQPITQAKLGQVHQQPPVSQMLPAVIPITSQKHPQALTIQKHPQPFTATTFTQPQSKQSEMQPPVMPQTQSSIMSQTYQYLPATGNERQTMRHPPTLIQPQVITQRYTFAAQSSPQQTKPVSQSQGITMLQAQPKSTASVQPRIITMPPSQPQSYKSPQSPQSLPQVMAIDQTHDNIQLRPQSHTQQPQWKPIIPDIMTQRYHEAPHQGFMPFHMSPQVPFQSQGHPQMQGVTQTPAQPHQWSPLRGGPVTQTYTQSQGYPGSQPQSQQCGQFRSESELQPYSQISPQRSIQSLVTSQQWQPLRQSDIVRHSYPQVQMSEYPQAQHKVTPRPQSTVQQWPMQPEPQSQVQFLKMFPQPMAQTPWVQTSSHTTVRPEVPAPQQPQTQQQQWPQNRPEVGFQIQSQSLQSQPQVLQKTQLPEQEQPQQKLVAQVRPPALAPVVLQGPAQQQPQNEQQQWPQNRAEAPFQFQMQSQTIQTQPHVQALQSPQSPLQEQLQPHFVPEIKPPTQAEVPLQDYSENYEQAQLQECEMALPAIQRQSSGDRDMTPTDSE